MEGIACDDQGGIRCNAEPFSPSLEMCADGLDNDCDGETDEGFNVGEPCWLEGYEIEGVWVCSEDGLSQKCFAEDLDFPELCEMVWITIVMWKWMKDSPQAIRAGSDWERAAEKEYGRVRLAAWTSFATVL